MVCSCDKNKAIDGLLLEGTSSCFVLLLRHYVLQLKYNPAKVAEVDKLLKVIFAQECYCFRALTVLTCEQSYSIKDICKGLTREYAAMSFVQRNPDSCWHVGTRLLRRAGSKRQATRNIWQTFTASTILRKSLKSTRC